MKRAEILLLFWAITACSVDPFIPLVTSRSILRSYVAERLYLNSGYDFTKRQVVSVSPIRGAADFYLYYDPLAAGNKYRIGTPMEKRFFPMTVAAGSSLDEVSYAEPYSTNAYMESVSLVGDQWYSVYTPANCYALLHVIEFQNTGSGASTYIRFEWKLQRNGNNVL